MDSDKSKIIQLGAKFLAWLAKPLYFRANVRPILHRTKKQLERKYGTALVESPEYRLKLGSKNPALEHGIFRVYLPPSELFRKLNEDREAMLIQHYIRNSLVPDLQFINKEFHDAVCIAETNELLEKDENARTKVRNYNRQIMDKNPENSYLIPVAVATDQGRLKPILKKSMDRIETDRKKKGRLNPKTISKIKQDLEIEKNKWKQEISVTERNLDTMPDKDLIKNAQKSIFEMSRKYSAEEVVRSMVQGKHLRTNDGKILSYVLVAETIRDNPGITSKKLAQILGKPEVSYIHYGVIALLTHKKGLGLIKRKKSSGVYMLYPSESFKQLLEKYSYQGQKQMSEY